MREAEPTEPVCPGCGTAGEPVGAATLEAQLAADVRAPLGDRAYYCVASGCRTAYFNGWGASVAVERVASPAWPKDPAAPICPCFGIAAADVIADARDGRKDRVKSLVDRSQGPEARCAARCPDGRSCLPRVLRLFRETLEGMR